MHVNVPVDILGRPSESVGLAAFLTSSKTFPPTHSFSPYTKHQPSSLYSGLGVIAVGLAAIFLMSPSPFKSYPALPWPNIRTIRQLESFITKINTQN